MKNKQLQTYGRLSTEFYDLEDHINHAQALAFYMQHAKQAQGAILEPMCGSGRFLIPILQASLAVEGFDASPFMIDALQKKYAELSTQQAPAWQQFVQDFERDKRYQLIFIPYGSWGLITNLAESKKGLESLYRHLEPGGKLLVEIETIASVPQPCGVWRRAIHTKEDGSKIALSFVTSYQPETQLFQSNAHYELIVNNKVESHEEELFEQYLYRIDEFDELLRACGCTTIKKYPAFDPTKSVSHDTPIIIYEGSK